MLDVFKYELRPSYPHMSEADRSIWERFIVKYPDEFASVRYDFHVGDPPPFNTLDEDGTDRNQDKLYRKRIDVVGHTPTQDFVIEIKPSAGMSVVGQVKGYAWLYKEEKWSNVGVTPMIITDAMSTDTQRFCEREGVMFIVI